MNQSLSIYTGCAAGATESFVVVPFELVKIKYVVFPCVCYSLDVLREGCSDALVFLNPALKMGIANEISY